MDRWFPPREVIQMDKLRIRRTIKQPENTVKASLRFKALSFFISPQPIPNKLAGHALEKCQIIFYDTFKNMFFSSGQLKKLDRHHNIQHLTPSSWWWYTAPFSLQSNTTTNGCWWVTEFFISITKISYHL